MKTTEEKYNLTVKMEKIENVRIALTAVGGMESPLISIPFRQLQGCHSSVRFVKITPHFGRSQPSTKTWTGRPKFRKRC